MALNLKFNTDHCLRQGVVAETMDSVQNFSHMYHHLQSLVP